MEKFFCILSDFPDDIAKATLDDLPNSLYKATAYSADLEQSDLHPQTTLTFDQGQTPHHGKINRRRNNGTNPSMGKNSVADSHSYEYSQSASGSVSGLPGWPAGVVASEGRNSMQTLGNFVPYNLYENNMSPHGSSYASIAQKGPSQNKYNMVAGQPDYSSVAMVTSDEKTCDNSNKHEKANRRVPKTGNKPRYGNVNVNVVDLMQDLERADALGGSANPKVASVQSNPANTYQQTHASEKKLSYSSVVQEPAKLGSNSGQLVKSQASNSDQPVPSGSYSAALQSQGQSQQGVKGQTASGGTVSELHDLLVKSQNHMLGLSDGNNNEGDVKKKRRRRRRRKKKSGDGEGAENDDANSGANEEITLHFEDEDEFPDLAAGMTGSGDGNIGNHDNNASIAYSDIVKNNVSSGAKAIFCSRVMLEVLSYNSYDC